MQFPGKKTKDIFENLIKENLPSNLGDFIYVEPFAGTFAIGNLIKELVKTTIYNDIHKYEWLESNVSADIIHHLDYMEIIDKYDSENTIFYIDPPYFKKEYVYDLEHDKQMHVDLYNKLKSIKGLFILSYESHPEIIKLYNGFKIQYYSGNKQLHRKEIIIHNG